MSASNFRINQEESIGSYNLARTDLVIGYVTCEAESQTEDSYLWEIIEQPYDQSIVITGSTTHTCTFSILSEDSFLLRLTVNAGTIDESATTLFLGVPLSNSGICLPAFQETNQDNSVNNGLYGHAHKLKEIIRYLDESVSVSNLDIYRIHLNETESIEFGGFTAPPLNTSNLITVKWLISVLEYENEQSQIVYFMRSHEILVTTLTHYDGEGFEPSMSIISTEISSPYTNDYLATRGLNTDNTLSFRVGLYGNLVVDYNNDNNPLTNAKISAQRVSMLVDHNVYFSPA